jgi:hypothetical protein
MSDPDLKDCHRNRASKQGGNGGRGPGTGGFGEGGNGGLGLLILSRSICTLAQFTFLGVEPKTDEAKDAPIGRPVTNSCAITRSVGSPMTCRALWFSASASSKPRSSSVRPVSSPRKRAARNFTLLGKNRYSSLPVSLQQTFVFNIDAGDAL